MQNNGRMEELEGRFSQLADKLKESPEKEAISILHAMILQNASNANRQRMSGSKAGTPPAGEVDHQPGLEEIASLYKSAPPMEGQAINQGLPVGAKAPNFSLKDAQGRVLSLSDYRGEMVLLVFYPLDWSPACSDQLSLYQSELSEIERLGTRVLAISVDSIYSHGAWAAVRGITFPLLADFNPKGDVARQYKIWREPDGFSERALYIVDRNGVIRYSHISPELHKIPDIYELFEQLKAVGGQAGKAASK